MEPCVRVPEYREVVVFTTSLKDKGVDWGIKDPFRLRTRGVTKGTDRRGVKVDYHLTLVLFILSSKRNPLFSQFTPFPTQYPPIRQVLKRETHPPVKDYTPQTWVNTTLSQPVTEG